MIDKIEIDTLVKLIQHKKFKKAEDQILIFLKKKKEAIFYNLYGIIFLEQKKYKEAITKFELSLKYDPKFFKSYNNLGIAFYNLKKYKEACENYIKAIKLNSNFEQAHNNMGSSLLKLRKYDEAIKFFKKSININSKFIDPYINLGKFFLKKKNSKAIKYFEKALSFKENNIEIIYNLGLAYKNDIKHDIAEGKFKLAIKLNPKFYDAFSDLGVLYIDMNRIDEAINCFKNAISINPNLSSAYHNLFFAFNHLYNFPIDDYFLYSKKYRSILKNVDKECLKYSFDKKPKKIKVGFISGDFDDHPVGYFLLDLIKNLENTNIETYAYSNKFLENNDITLQFKINFNHWIEIFDKTDLETINQIRSDGIHILIDLSGHTKNNRLSIFPSKPAPIQLTWLGCNISTGIPQIKYIIGDKHSYLDSKKKFFVEKFWKMPEVPQCLSKYNLDPTYKETPAKKNGFVTFGSFNNITKLNDKVIETWSKVLKLTKNSKIILKHRLLENEKLKNIIIKKFISNNVEDEKIIIKKGVKSRNESLETYNNIDIALDTFPYNGVTTSHEAIMMGVPILTKKGDHPYSKMGESLNKNIGMEDWIAKDNEDYVSKAIYFSRDINQLSLIKKNLIRKIPSTSSFNSSIFTGQFKNELWKIWEEYSNG